MALPRRQSSPFLMWTTAQSLEKAVVHRIESTEGAALSRKRSFVFDLPEKLERESEKQRRLRVHLDNVAREKTVSGEMEEAKWFADPWCERISLAGGVN